jgi:uncharacterized Zn finger protein
MKKITSITRLILQDFIEEHAIPSNIVYGKAIKNRNAVEMIEFGDTRVEAWVGGLDGAIVDGGGSKRRVEFIASEAGLKWHCTGNPKDHQIFCKHCVALALELMKGEAFLDNTGSYS